MRKLLIVDVYISEKVKYWAKCILQIVMHQPGFKGKLKTKLPQDEDNYQKTDVIMWGKKPPKKTPDHLSLFLLYSTVVH